MRLAAVLSVTLVLGGIVAARAQAPGASSSAPAAAAASSAPAAAAPVVCPAPAPAVRPRRAGAHRPGVAVAAPPGGCYRATDPARACMTPRKLCEQDLRYGQIAWKYFENNLQKTTGLVNAVDKYPSTTMWDAASALAGTVAARQLGIIDEKQFDDRITPLLSTLLQLKLFAGEAPNKAYDTRSAQMTDYANKPSATGIGISALDLGRLASWLQLLGCMFPKHGPAAQGVLERWSYCRVIKEGQMHGAYYDAKSKQPVTVQEGRLGYEQYAGKMFGRLGFDQHVSQKYGNAFANSVSIYGLPIAFDIRDPRKLGAYNYVVTESYALDALEFGLDRENTPLARNIFEVQKRRWRETGIVTAVSEDNLDRPPYFVYNTIFAAGTPWNTITDQGVDQSAYRSVSVKAAFSLATMFPADEYSQVLLDKISTAYDPERGWYSGIYESGLGYNKAMTANTNGIILEALLYKAYGPLHPRCAACGPPFRLGARLEQAESCRRCLPTCREACGAGCSTARR